MRLGISTDLGKTDAVEWAKAIRESGCGSVVFPLDYTAPEEKIQSFAKAAREQNLVIAEVGAWCNPIAPNPMEREAALNRTKEQLRLADKIGANCCANVAGSAGEKWAGAYRENFTKETWDLTVKTIQEIIDDVRPQNTYYTIEPMPYMYPMDVNQYLHLMEDVNRERFAVHMDFFNWLNTPDKYFHHEEYMEECFEKLGPWIKSCHLKDVLLLQELTCMLKEVPCCLGGINLEKYILLAERYNPEMPMIMEHLKSQEEYLDGIARVKERLKGSKVTFI